MKMSKKFLIRELRFQDSNPLHFVRFVPIFLSFVAIFIASLGLTGSAQRAPQQSATTTSAARNAALIAATVDVLKETSEIRQLAILRPVQSSTQSRPEIERTLIKNLDEDMTAAQAHASEVVLRKLGLAPADFQYRALMIRLLTEQVAGYYDPKTQQFHLADWIDLDGQKPIMAHELTHALQDQHFNLRRFEHWPKGDSDAELAAHALIEGDATLAMALYVRNNPLRALAFLKSLGSTGLPSQELDKAPRALRETLLFPYEDGEKWVNALYKQGGWARVSKAFTELPQSTEQILHPEKYFAQEPPVKVTLPDVAPVLDRSSSAEIRGRRLEAGQDLPRARPPAWKRLDSDVNGEWGFYLILDQFLKSPAESRRAAAGWGGDRFALYEGPRGEAMLVSLSVWDTENDAREFFDAYIKRTELRYPVATSIEPTIKAQSPLYSRSFQTSDGVVSIEVRGGRVLILEGVPPRADVKSLKGTLWR
jgi:hypothetical protein